MAKISRLKRAGFFLLAFGWLVGVFLNFEGSGFLRDSISMVLFSSLLMLAFTSCFMEHFFTKPTDVISSTIGILLLMAPLGKELSAFGQWYNYFLVYNIFLLITALTAILLLDDKKLPSSYSNIASTHLKHISTYFGKGKLLYGTIFLLTLLFYVKSEESKFLWLLLTAMVLLIVDPKAFIQNIPEKNKGVLLEVGKIFGVQSKRTFLVKLFKDRTAIVNIFDFVEFNYSMDKGRSPRKGLVIDNYLLNEEQQMKVLWSKEIEDSFSGVNSGTSKLEENIVYKIPNKITKDNKFLERFVGIVIEGTNIERLRFEYASNKKVQISEGDLLEVNTRDKVILYQVVQGMTNIEMLESKNEAGMIIGEAVQLGEWNSIKQQFEKFGWVPEMNTPVMLASNTGEVTLSDGEYQVGIVPNTNFPCILNKDDAISHHMAILGVTGSGKSVFARELVRNIAKDDWRVICVDFTGEYKGRFSASKPVPIIRTKEESAAIFTATEKMCAEIAKTFKGDEAVIRQSKKIIIDKFKIGIKQFLESTDNKLAVFELPEVSNTDVTLEYTKWFFKVLFDIAKKEKSYGKKICVVLEEAHTVVPEYGFSGMSDKTSQALVNSVAQIALQGRKYNIGFILIAQRTANVSKTVLTQCNSFIAFQQFDKTSADFFSNLFGKDMVATLPRLKNRQAIAVGKAFKANMPIIFEVGEITEEPFVLPDTFKEETTIPNEVATEETLAA